MSIVESRRPCLGRSLLVLNAFLMLQFLVPSEALANTTSLVCQTSPSDFVWSVKIDYSASTIKINESKVSVAVISDEAIQFNIVVEPSPSPAGPKSNTCPADLAQGTAPARADKAQRVASDTSDVPATATRLPGRAPRVMALATPTWAPALPHTARSARSTAQGLRHRPPRR